MPASIRPTAAAGPRPAPPAHPDCVVRLLGDVAIDSPAGTLRPPTRATAALLARLAMWPDRAHAREALVELLWPGVALDVGRNRLRQALSTLKGLLEQAASATIIEADRSAVRVIPGSLGCDVVRFEAACRAGQSALAQACYRGELMPGFFDEWICDERLRLEGLLDRLPLPVAPVAGSTATAPAAYAAPVPTYLTRMFGRDGDRSRLADALQGHRLVSLVGPGGAGKTRLAAEFAGAWSVRSDPSDGGRRLDLVHFVSLVGCERRADVLQALATALGCDATQEAVVQALGGREALLVLDNFEHLVEPAADLVRHLLARVPGLRLLVTSRRALGIDGERLVSLEPLGPPSADLPLAQAAEHPALALFVDRARAAHAAFRLGADNLADVCALVGALDGLPLALELAAARCRTLSPAQMLAMLASTPEMTSGTTRGPTESTASSPLGLLSRPGARGEQDRRQASMDQALAWSWQLLSPESRSLLAALTVFRASFSAEAVAWVCELSPVQAAVQLDMLADHSLVQVQPGQAGGMRHRLLEVIREFARLHLDASHEQALRRRLLQRLIEWARREGRMPRPDRIEAELPDVHAALMNAQALGQPQEAVLLALALRDYWELDGMPPHTQQALARLLDAHGPGWPDALRSDAHELLAYTGLGAGDGSQALRHAEAALALAGDDDRRRGRALLRHCWVKLALDYQSPGLDEPLAQALSLALATGDVPLQARVLHQQGIVRRYQHRDLPGAEALMAQAQALWQALGNPRLAHARLRNRAQCWAAQGLHEQALASFMACGAAARAEGDWVGIIDSTLGAATALDRLRRWADAVEANRECIRVSWRRHHAHGLAYALWNIAHPMLRSGRAESALRLMAFAAVYWSQHMGPLREDDRRDMGRIQRLARRCLPPPVVAVHWDEGSRLTAADAVALALAG